MPMFIVLKEYLTRLEILESRLPESEKRAPTVTELAAAIGTSRANLSKIINNQTPTLRLDLASKIITEMRRRGFPMRETDLLIYRDPESA